MHSNCFRPALLSLFALALSYVPVFGFAQTVTTQLKSGATLRAVVDERTDESRLWLRASSDHTTVLKPLAWEQVARVSFHGRDLDKGQTIQLPETWANARKDTERRVQNFASARPNGESYADQVRRALSGSRRVGVVEMFATVDSAKEEVLVVRIAASDLQRRTIVLNGVLELEWPGLNQPVQIKLQLNDFDGTGSRVRIPLQDLPQALPDQFQVRLFDERHGWFDSLVQVR